MSEPEQVEVGPVISNTTFGSMVTVSQTEPVQPVASVTVTQYWVSAVGETVMVWVVPEPASSHRYWSNAPASSTPGGTLAYGQIAHDVRVEILVFRNVETILAGASVRIGHRHAVQDPLRSP